MATWTLPCHRHVLVDLLSLISSSIGQFHRNQEQAAKQERTKKEASKMLGKRLTQYYPGTVPCPGVFLLYSLLCVKKRVSIFTVGFVVLTFTR